MDKLNIAIVDDHKIFRDGFRLVLESMKNINRIEEASNGKEFLALLDQKKENKPDIVFMDINMPVLDGIETTRKALEKDPNLSIIALTSYDYIEYVQKMMHEGVEGYLLKDADYKDIEVAIDQVSNGYSYFSQDVMNTIAKNAQQNINKQPEKTELTKREKELLQLMCDGHSKQVIAEKLFISERTVEKHKENIMNKTNTRTTVNMILFAIKNKLVEI